MAAPTARLAVQRGWASARLAPRARVRLRGPRLDQEPPAGLSACLVAGRAERPPVRSAGSREPVPSPAGGRLPHLPADPLPETAQVQAQPESPRLPTVPLARARRSAPSRGAA